MAKGKYAAVVKQLPRYLGEEPDYQEKVNVVKLEIKKDPSFAQHASWLAKRYTDVREEIDHIKDLLYDANLELTAFTQLLLDQMENEGISSLKLDTGRAISTWAEPYAQVIDKEAFRVWCLEHGFERSMVLHPSTTQSLIKERLLAGEAEPPGISIFAKDVIRLGSER